MKTIREYIGNNSYPGRGILVGMTKDNKAVVGYFISGRSENSRNRVFEADEAGDVFTKPFDESKVEDPSLIIYRAVAHIDGGLIVTNGDQTDTVARFMACLLYTSTVNKDIILLKYAAFKAKLNTGRIQLS